MRSFVLVVLLAVVASLAFSQGAASAGTPDQQKVDADKLYNEGNGLFRSGNYSGAIEKYQAALKLNKDFKYFYQLGLAYKNSRQNDNAIAALKESVTLKNDLAPGYNALGGIYLATGDYDNSLESFKQALRYNPNLEPARKGIAEAYAGKIQQLYDNGRFKEAGALSDESRADDPTNAKLHLLAARVYNRLEEPEKVIAAAEAAIKHKKRGPNGAEYFEIGVAYKKLQAFEKARAAFLEAKKDPTYSRNAQYELDGIKGR
jgi:tetratricopeptide (TPR) repeat protein